MAGIKSEGNITLSYNSNDITDYVSQIQLEAAVAELESTDLGSTAQEFEPGLANFNITFNIIKWDATLDGYLQGDALSPGSKRTVALAVTDDSSNTVTYTWSSNGFLTGYNIGGQTGGLIGGDGGIRLSGAPTRTTS